MTESEWRTCTNPHQMLTSFPDKISARQLRLFACACCRRFWPQLTCAGTRRAVETAERLADKQATERERASAVLEVDDSGDLAVRACRLALSPDAGMAARETARAVTAAAARIAEEFAVSFEAAESVVSAIWREVRLAEEAAAETARAVDRNFLPSIRMEREYTGDVIGWMQAETAAADAAVRRAAKVAASLANRANANPILRFERQAAYTSRRAAERTVQHGKTVVRSVQRSLPDALAQTNPAIRTVRRTVATTMEQKAQANLLREIVGDPFRRIAVEPAWRTATVLLLAQSIYKSHDFVALPILGDALEDAGCTDEGLLRHCRNPNEHVPGCWLLDALLEKG